MSTREEEFLKRLQATFRLEAEEHLQAISDGLFKLEEASTSGDNSNASIEDIYRDAHSLKGAARAVNMSAVESVCQSLESVLSEWKRDKIRAVPALFDTLNRTLSVIAHILELPTVQRASVSADDYSRVLQELQQWQEGNPPSSQIAPAEENQTSLSVPRNRDEPQPAVDYSVPVQNGNGPANIFHHSNRFENNGRKPESAPETNREETGRSNMGSPPLTVPEIPVTPSSPPIEQVASEPVAVEPIASETVAPQPWHASDSGSNGNSLAPTTSTANLPTASEPTGSVPTGSVGKIAPVETVRIATAKLDSLLLQAEELLSAKQTLAQRASDVRELQALIELYERKWSKIARLSKDNKDVRGEFMANSSDSDGNEMDLQSWNSSYTRMLDAKLKTLSSSLEQDRRSLNSMVDTLLDDMKQVLMMPFSSLFEVFPRLVRDLTRSLGKEARLEMQGSEIEIDRRILEEMKDPLIHLIRNAIDHGLESTVERERRGKSLQGTVRLMVHSHESGRVEIIVADDGAGIDSNRVREAAVEKGAITYEQAAELDDEQSRMLIFQSEVSTSAMITDLSGRGLGMAIVRDKVEKMGGHISIDTEIGRGTAFRIVLPLTLATFRGILLESAQCQFIIPTANVERVLRLPKIDIKIVGGHRAIVVNGQTLSVVGLNDVLELSAARHESEHLTIVILGSGDRRVGFLIDEVLSEQEVLVKSLGSQLVRVRNIAGATVLGSGRVVPILNASDLIKSALRAGRSGLAPSPSESAVENVAQDNPKKSILIAEDSITSRMLIKNILESAGYRVKTTIDGAEALAAFRANEFDLVVSDVEMPRMNGFELTEGIRSDKNNGNVPVILVTSLSSREHQERGMDAGANAYIVKSSFDQGNLLDAVRRLISHAV